MLRITHKELSLSLLKLTSDTSTCFIIVFKSNKYQYIKEDKRKSLQMIKAKRTAEDIFKARMRTILNEYGNT